MKYGSVANFEKYLACLGPKIPVLALLKVVVFGGKKDVAANEN